MLFKDKDSVDRVRERLRERAVTAHNPERSQAYREAAEMLPGSEPESVVRYRALARCYALFSAEVNGGGRDYGPAARFVEARFMPGESAVSFGNFQADLIEAVRHARSLAISDVEARLEVETAERTVADSDGLLVKAVVHDPVTGASRTTTVMPVEQDILGADTAGISHTMRDLAERIIDRDLPRIDGVHR
jgi:hypothetical protein